MNHQPSPYLRRYRLPQLGFSTPPRAYYDDMLSPMEELQTKLELINFKNQQLVRSLLPPPVPQHRPPPLLIGGGPGSSASTSSLESGSSTSFPSPYCGLRRNGKDGRCLNQERTLQGSGGDFNANNKQSSRMMSMSPKRATDRIQSEWKSHPVESPVQYNDLNAMQIQKDRPTNISSTPASHPQQPLQPSEQARVCKKKKYNRSRSSKK